MYNFKFKMKEIRTKQGITQHQMAELLDTKQQVISKYENQEIAPSLERLVDIAGVLNVTLDELIEMRHIHEEYSNNLKNKLEGE